LATIGRSSAIAYIGGFKISGLLAWLTWLFVHLLFLIGFRNRVQVLGEWFWDYITFQRGARLITGQSRSIVPLVPGEVHEQDMTDSDFRRRKIV
jgi:NADH dehydrogenase